MTPFKALLDKKFALDAGEARIATLRLCLEEEVSKREEDNSDIGANTLTARRVFYALQKLTDENVGRERTLQMALEVLPQTTVMDALPPTLVIDLVGRAEQDLARDIQAAYDIETSRAA
jgi:methylphosphotriester-DNA--protein-cysteine methyltransferase